jgi:UDP-glucose 4-epimerase
MTNTYGPRQLVKHARQGFMGWFIHQIVDGNEIQIFGDGNQVRDFNFVDDVVEAMLLGAVNDEANGQFYNLGGDERVSLRDLVVLMIELNGGGSYRLVPFPEEIKQIDIGDFYADYSKARQVLGWHPKTRLRDGLARTIDYYKENIAQYRS